MENRLGMERMKRYYGLVARGGGIGEMGKGEERDLF